jgi:5-methylcytosine-specific restriction protein A
MPTRPGRPCTAPGCPELVAEGKCEKHRVAHEQQVQRWRGTASSRGYGWAWQKLAGAHKRKHPLCVECLKQGSVTAADDVDHIVPFQGLNDPLRLDPSNLRSLCRPHHNAKTHSTCAPTTLTGQTMTTGKMSGAED